MTSPAQFPYQLVNPGAPTPCYMPLLPLTLERDQQSIAITALVDSGAAVNLLPYSVGMKLGANWHALAVPLPLAGNVAHVPAKALAVTAKVGAFQPVRLLFAWAISDAVPTLLGEMNFFMEFDVCFLRSRLMFEVQPKP